MTETVIYYPYYELEKDKLISKPNHLLNIKTFLLLADKVLIPPAHILETELNNILSLKDRVQPFIDSGSIYTTVGKTNKTLTDYYQQKKEESTVWDKITNTKATEIIEIFSSVEAFQNRDRIKQSYLYYDYLNELIFKKDDIGKHFTQYKLNLIQNEIKSLLDKKGYLLSKADFDESINKLIKTKKIDKQQFKMLSDFSNSAYYYVGCIGNNSSIGFSSYFQDIEISKLKSDFEFGPILFYDPKFFISFLSKIGLAITETDIQNLTSQEIEEIRQHDGFKKFKKTYQNFCSICQQTLDDKVYEAHIKNKFGLKFKSTKWLISYSTFLATLGLVGTSNPYTLILFFLSLAESYFSSNTIMTKKLFAKSIDKIRIGLTSKIDPFNSFLLKIENVINEK